MEKRRQKRDAMRKKQRADAKRLRLTLLAAGLAIICCVLGFRYLAETEGVDRPTPPSTEPTLPQETTVATEPSPLTTIHIRAAGDLNVTDNVVSSGIAVNGYDYSGAFKDVSAVLSNADLTLLNLEGNLCGEPYGTETTSAPQRLAEDLRGCGVDLIQMANSCSINNGINGLVTTLQSLRAAGIEPVGAFANDAEFKRSKGFTIAEVQGIKIAFVAFTKGLGGRGMPAGSENLVNLLYTDYNTDYQNINTAYINAVLKDVQGEQPDLTVVLLHWGSEYNDDISKTQKSIVSLLQKRGVNIILGTHPHTVQPVDFDKTKGTLVAYSLGDFFGDADRGGTNYSIILDVEITKDTITGDTRVTDFSYEPICTVRDTDAMDAKWRVMRIESAMKSYGYYDDGTGETPVGYTGRYLDSVTKSAYESMRYALTRIDARLKMPTTATK